MMKLQSSLELTLTYVRQRYTVEQVQTLDAHTLWSGLSFTERYAIFKHSGLNYFTQFRPNYVESLMKKVKHHA